MFLKTKDDIERLARALGVEGGEDHLALDRLAINVTEVGSGRDVLRQGAIQPDLCLILSGVVGRYKTLAGGQRQVLSLHFPGDIPNALPPVAPLDYGIVSFSASRVALIEDKGFRDMATERPAIAAALVDMAASDASLARAWLANIGRRPAARRLAHLLCETAYRRYGPSGPAANLVSLPLTQADLADALGLSIVHVNRVTQELRRGGLIRTRRGGFEVSDWPRLQAFGEFEPAYLQPPHQWAP